MRIETLEFFWSLFDNPGQASRAAAKKHLRLGAEDVPAEVQRFITDKRIHELQGEFGLPGAGGPEVGSGLAVTARGRRGRIGGLNHAIALWHADS